MCLYLFIVVAAVFAVEESLLAKDRDDCSKP